MTASPGPQTSPLPVLQTPDPGPDPLAGPIFVDSTGRRLRRVRAIWVLALAIVAAYALLLGVALLGGPNVAAPYLPRQAVGAPAPSAPPSPTASSAATAEGPDPSSGARAQAAAHPAGNEPAAVPQPGAVQAPATAAPAPAATAAPAAPVPAATAAPAPVPSAASGVNGKSDTAPGQTTRPTAPAHP
jgi:cytoskeletal protein RodZ